MALINHVEWTMNGRACYEAKIQCRIKQELKQGNGINQEKK